MISRDDLPAEIRELINACVDDRLDDAGRDRLQQLIVADPQVRRAYVQMMSMLGGVHRFLQERPSLPSSVVATTDESANTAAVGSMDQIPLVFDEFTAAESASGGWWKFGIVQSLLFTLVVALGTGYWWLTPDRNQPIILADKQEQTLEMPLEVRTVRLDSGTARLTLPKVGYVIVEGPAEFNLLGPKRARLNKGRIKMRVTEASGRGFVVETPDGEVTDLGTEFGLDVTSGRETGLVVFEGSVNLRVAEARATEPARVELFSGGEGAVFNKEGRLDRIVSIVTGDLATFNLPSQTDLEHGNAVIANVADNYRTADTKKFYEIVPGGLREDVLAYVDRVHQWNGTSAEGIPAYLLGADYIKTFNDDNTKINRKIYLTIARPAKLYVFLDVRAEPPAWLTESFRDTGDIIGLDAAPNSMKEFRDRRLMSGPGNAIDEHLRIWERVVDQPGVVVLGGNGATTAPFGAAMYGIAAVPLEVKSPAEL